MTYIISSVNKDSYQKFDAEVIFSWGFRRLDMIPYLARNPSPAEDQKTFN